MFLFVQIDRMNWDCEGVCVIKYPSTDNVATLLNSLPSSDTHRPTTRQLATTALQVYDFHKLNNINRRSYYKLEQDLLPPVLQDAVNASWQNALVLNETAADEDCQEYSFPNVLPGDSIVVRVGWDEKRKTVKELIEDGRRRLQEKVLTPIVLLHLGTTEASPDTVTPE